MRITREAKLYPNKTQTKLLEDTLEKCRMLYNHCLEMKINKHKATGENIHRFELEKLVKNWDIPSNVRSGVVHRLDLAYQKFFKSSGFPRFKANGRYRSFSLKKYKIDYRFKDEKLMLYKKYGFSPIRMRGLQELLQPKEGRIVKRANGWYLQVTDIIAEAQPKAVKSVIGIDYGLKHFIVDTNGRKVKSLKVLRRLENKLASQQRIVAKRKRGSSNRNKAKMIVARTHQKIRNKRLDYLHKLSREYAIELMSRTCKAYLLLIS